MAATKVKRMSRTNLMIATALVGLIAMALALVAAAVLAYPASTGDLAVFPLTLTGLANVGTQWMLLVVLLPFFAVVSGFIFWAIDEPGAGGAVVIAGGILSIWTTDWLLVIGFIAFILFAGLLMKLERYA